MIFPKYNYCPNCGEKFQIVDKNFQICKNCNFIYYPTTPLTSAVFIKKESKVLLVKRKNEPFKNYWSLPAGFANYGENPIDAGLRELKEETNLEAKFKSILGIFIADDHPKTFSVLTVIEAKDLGGKIIAKDDAKEIKFFEKNKLPKIAFKAHRDIISKYL